VTLTANGWRITFLGPTTYLANGDAFTGNMEDLPARLREQLPPEALEQMRTVNERFQKIVSLLDDERVHLPFTVVHAERVDYFAIGEQFWEHECGRLKFYLVERPAVGRPAKILRRTMSNLTLWSRPAWDIDRWVRDFFGPAATNDWFGGAFTPAAEVVKEGDDAVVRVELPGIDVEKDVNVDVDGGYLVIHGERRDEHSEDTNGRTLREVRYGSFRRAFRLPKHVTGDAVSASYDAGVLTVRVTGAYAGSHAQRIAITQ
jgi:HSP20 family protein